MAMPVCKNTSTEFKSYSSEMADVNTYLGNVSSADWLYSGYVVDYDDEDSLLLAMPKNSGGTLLSSTRYLWYGKVSARLRSSHLAGVVTAFIVFSNVQDEIDFEWVGADLETVQSNYYFQGHLNYTHSKNFTTTDTFEDFHTYEIDWHEEYINWSLDGVVGRTLYKNETYNETSKEYAFPQTPARIQISLWPGGNATQPEGTRSWAGGEIDWDSADIQDPGYYYMTLNEINVTCYETPSNTVKNGTEAYVYTGGDEYQSSGIAITNETLMLYSSEGSGLQPLLGKDNSTSSSASSSSHSSSHSSSSTSASSSSHTSSGKSSVSSQTSSDAAPSSIASTELTSSIASGEATSSSSLTPEQSTGFVQNIKSSSTSTGPASTVTASKQANAGNSLKDGFTFAALVGVVVNYLL